MSYGIHMLICCILSVELLLAGLARALGCPMITGRHVLVCCHLRAKLAAARLAFKDRQPVIRVVHVLVTSTLGAKGAGTGIAFWPVAIVGHMVFAFILVPEGIRAGLALEHLSGRT
jgi:hypothetical protein